MSIGIRVPRALSGAAIETRGGWTWSFPCDRITGAGTWPALDGGATAQLALSGLVDLEQYTPGLGARGAGSARINKAVLGGAGGRWLSGATYPNPVMSPLLARLIFRETRAVGTATYFELSQAAQRLTIRRDGSDLELVANLGAYTETVFFSPFFETYLLLDVILDPAAQSFRAYLNGIDLTPSFAGAGGAIAAFAGAASLALLNNVAGSDAAVNTELVFVGLATSPTLTFSQHREDAYALEVLESGFAVDGLGGYTWAWSPNRVDTETQPAPTLPGEPDFGDTAARLTVDETVQFGLATGPLRSEGLALARRNTAFAPTDAADWVYKSAPSGFPIVDGDLHVRIIFKVNASGSSAQRILFLEDPADPTLRFGVEVDPATGALTVYAPSGYSSTLAAAAARDEWHLLDASLDRDNGSGVAQLTVLLDGVNLNAVAHGALVADIPASAEVTFFDDRDHGGSATAALIVFAALTRGRVLTLDRHRLDALALGVMI